MSSLDEEIRAASRRFYDAVNAVLRGDAAPMLALWSHADDATYLDPRGILHRGWGELCAYWEEAARANSADPGALNATGEDVSVQASDTLACTLSREHVRKRGDGTSGGFSVYATNVYRLEEGAWHMTHRHAEMPHDTSQ